MKILSFLLACFCVGLAFCSDQIPVFDAGGYYQAIPNKIVEVNTIADIRSGILEAKHLGKKITIGGYRHSQAGHTVLDDSIHLNMKNYNKIVSIDLENRTVTVESGIDWVTLLEYLKDYQMTPRIMQDLSTFTVGGSMGSNILGRNPNAPPIINSIVSFTFMDAEGNVRNISRQENKELFSLVIGGYGLFGVVLEVKLDIVPNDVLEEVNEIVSVQEYSEYVKKMRSDPSIHFHSGYLDENGLNVIVKNFYSVGTLSTQPRDISRSSVLSRKPIMNYWVQDNSNNLISFAIPESFFKDFIEYANAAVQASGLKILRITTKHIARDTESTLTLIKDDSIVVAFIFNLNPNSQQPASDLKKRLTLGALQLGGNVYLTFSHEIDHAQMKELYPSWEYFLKKKHEYDPEERFSSQFFERSSQEK